MKIVRTILIVLALVLIIASSLLIAFAYSTTPDYQGTFTMSGISDSVEIHYDQFGVPHIYAHSEEDAYFALGFAHAQDRLFQMEMLRRAASGRLSEILGPDFVKTDKFFRSLGIQKVAEQSAKHYLSEATQPYQKAALAYQRGINRFVKSGTKPIEFYIMGIPMQEFSPEDFYYVAGFMAVGFAEGIRTDPILTSIVHKYDSTYLRSFSLHSIPGMDYLPSYQADSSFITLSNSINSIINGLPVPLIHGSNGWVIGKDKSATGQVMLANDTHIGFSQPSVWYEAHLNYPDHSIYGNYIAGFPFAMLGNNQDTAWGLTMLENDDVDFYFEEVHPDDSLKVRRNDEWVSMETRVETIPVKGSEPILFRIRTSHHGPIINDALDNFPESLSTPVSIYWNFTKELSNLVHAGYQLNTGRDIFDLRKAASMINAPGLNVMSADRNNFGWFTAASLINRPKGVNSKLFIDGSGKYDPKPDYDFSYNPAAFNTPWGYVYSTNNQPDTVRSVFHAGYYMPEDRGIRIKQLLSDHEHVTLDDMKEFQLNTSSPYATKVANFLVELCEDGSFDPAQIELVSMLKGWDGNHHRNSREAAVYYTILGVLFNEAMADEVGAEMLQTMTQLAFFKRSMLLFLQDNESPWWDNIRTDSRETRSQILSNSLRKADSLLRRNLGNDKNGWRWGKIHRLTHPHPLGTIGALAPLFNVGPNEVDGGNETVNNMMMTLTPDGLFPVHAGPSMRKIVVFGEEVSAMGILPTGQSGHFLSPYYGDQAKKHADGDFRIFWMNKEQVLKNSKNKITLIPDAKQN